MRTLSNKSILILVLTLTIGLGGSAVSTYAQCGGNFKTGYRKIVGPNFANYNVEDWTGDGKADFWRFQLDPVSSTQKIVIYPNLGGGSFGWDNPIVYTTNFAEEPSGTIADYDGDGKKDFVNSQFVYKNNGNGTFSRLLENFYPEDVDSPVVGTVGFFDVNNDNILDWVRINGVPNQGHSINYRLGNSNGIFGPRVDIMTGTEFMNHFKVVGDFNGDGRKDIAYKYYVGSAVWNFRVLINNGNGTFTPGPETNAADIPNTPNVADLNGDGKADLISIYGGNDTPNTRRLFSFKNNGDLTFTKTEITTFQVTGDNSYCANCAQTKMGDFNGDGFPDIVEFGNSFYSVHLNNGSGAFARTDYNRTYYSPDGLILADLNGDNKTDLFVRYKYSQYIGNVFGEQVIVIQYSQCLPFGETKVANFDGNDAPDLTRWNPGTGDWASMNGRWLIGVDTTVKTRNWGLGSLGDVPAPGDFDGDGKTDHSVYRDTTGTWYIRQSANGAWLVFKFGLPGDIAIPNDYDGGGKTDIAVWRPSDGNWYIWSTETQQFSAVHFGLSGDKPVPADYDGDGKTDVAVFRPSDGTWYYLKSSNGAVVIFRWGISTDKPIPADFDGDGSADITVWRNGDWYILRSSNSAFGFIHWGATNDIPMAVYDNGETAKPVVFRPSNWVWYNFSQPSTGLYFGGSQNVPIYFGLPNN